MSLQILNLFKNPLLSFLKNLLVAGIDVPKSLLDWVHLSQLVGVLDSTTSFSLDDFGLNTTQCMSRLYNIADKLIQMLKRKLCLLQCLPIAYLQVLACKISTSLKVELVPLQRSFRIKILGARTHVWSPKPKSYGLGQCTQSCNCWSSSSSNKNDLIRPWTGLGHNSTASGIVSAECNRQENRSGHDSKECWKVLGHKRAAMYNLSRYCKWTYKTWCHCLYNKHMFQQFLLSPEGIYGTIKWWEANSGQEITSWTLEQSKVSKLQVFEYT